MVLPEEIKSKIVLNKHTVDYTTGTDFPGNYPEKAGSKHWSAESYSRGISVQLISEEESTLEFDLIGIDAPISNAIRRVLLSEIPTIAIGECSTKFH